jgi:hypothetical protein
MKWWRKGSKSQPRDELGGFIDVAALAKWARLFIRIATGSIVVLFAWIQIRDASVADVVQKVSPELLYKTSLIIYFAGWVGGAGFDTSVQQRVYVTDPHGGHIKLESVALFAFFLVAAVALIVARTDDRYFATLLAIFTLANVLGWRHIVQRVRPMIVASREGLRRNLFRIEQLYLVDEYMTGRWQLHRFALMFLLITVMCIVAFFPPVRGIVGDLVASYAPVDTTVQLLPGSLFLLYVLIAEGWIWVRRIDLHIALRVIDQLNKKYKLRQPAA